MRVGLIDVDAINQPLEKKWPNLVLMKLSTWYKRLGAEIELLKPADILNGNNLFNTYDFRFGACVFDCNRDIGEKLRKLGVMVNGSGMGEENYKHVLSTEIERQYPDYSLYGIKDVAYGFLTRGCPRKCPFCIVSKKEGAQSKKVADLEQFWHGQKTIKLLDPNLLACENPYALLKQLIDSKAWVDFTQGIDVRLLDDDLLDLLLQIKIKTIHFAWDNPRDEKTREKLEWFARTAIKNKSDYVKYKCYVLTNYWSSTAEDLERVYYLRDLGIDPYLMIYDKEHAPRKLRAMQRWVNNKVIFRSCKRFDNYGLK